MSAPSFLNCRGTPGQGRAGEHPEDATLAQGDAVSQLRRWEGAAILHRRNVAGVNGQRPPNAADEQPPPDDLVGLALSGGGVRSAAFNLGFLQSLSESGLLRYVDYLCSVSGGGYIAGHFTALACSSARMHADDSPASFHDCPAARMGLADRQRLEPSQYRFRHMGDYLTDYVGFIWRYVMFTIPLLFWAACLLGIPATLVALLWRSCDLPIVRQYFDLVGLAELGTALHVGNETPMAFLPSVLCFLVLAVLVPVRLLYPKVCGLRVAVRFAVVAWLMSLGVSIAVYIGNGETSLGASTELQKIQTHFTWPLLLFTVLSFLPLLAGRKLMQSGREHAPRWKKLVFHIVIGGATVSAAFLMVHMMARENISGFATHRDSRLLPDDIYDWNAFLSLFAPGGPLAGMTVGAPPDAVARAEKLQAADFALRDQREQIVGRSTWDQWQSIPFINLFQGTWRLGVVHFGARPNARSYLSEWQSLRAQQRDWLDTFVNPLLSADPPSDLARPLTERLLDIAVYRADDATDTVSSGVAGAFALPSDQSPARPPLTVDDFQLDERRQLEAFFARRAGEMREGAALTDLTQRYLLHMTRDGQKPGDALQAFQLTAAERAQFNRLLLECLYPKIIRERTMVSTTIVPDIDQRYRAFWLAFWSVGFLVVGLVNINRLSPFYSYYRDRLNDYFVQTAPQALAAANAPARPRADDWDMLKNLQPWEVGAPYPLMLGSAFFMSKVGVVPPPTAGSAAGDAFKQHSFLFSPLYCGTAATGYERTDQYCGGDLRLCEAMAISGAALTPFMIDNLWFAGLMAAFNFRIGQWLPRPAECPTNSASSRCHARPLALLAELWRSQDPAAYAENWQMALVADGGFHDFFGLEELLVRRCRLIIVSDAGCNNDQYEFGALADVIRLARERHGIDIVDLDDDQAADLSGLRRIPGENRQQLYHTCLRIIYPQEPGESAPREGLIVYAQMSLTGREQIDLQQFRKIHPNFPDEPITNQFFSHGQIESYRQLGFHIGSVVCRDVHSAANEEGQRPGRQQIADDLVRGYLQEYYCHVAGAEPPAAIAGSDQLGGASAQRPATRILDAWRSPWFRGAVPGGDDPIFEYERGSQCRSRALELVQALLNRPWDQPLVGCDLSEREAVCLLLACHERNAGKPASRFLAGGRQILLRRLPRAIEVLPIPSMHAAPHNFVERMHVPDAAPHLLNLAHGVFESAGVAATVDFVICVMRWYGLQHINRWGFRSSLTTYRRELVEALSCGDDERLALLTRGWDLPVPSAVPEHVV